MGRRKLKIEELQRATVEQYHKVDKVPLIVVLDNIRSRNNIGSIFRTCDAFKIEEMLLCGISSTPPDNEIHKTALGAEDAVKWRYFKETVDAVISLKEQGYRLFSIEQTQNSLQLDQLQLQRGEKYAVVLGHELRGVQQEVVDLSDGSIEIPQFGTKHSLNVSVAAGIVIWELFRELR